MPDWFTAALATLPGWLWIYGIVGLPYALLLVPRHTWRSVGQLALLTLACGSALLTACMFVLGTFSDGRMTLPAILGVTGVLALIGWWLVWRKARTSPPAPPVPRRAFDFDERVIVLLIAAACILRALTSVYWVFTEYDPLWVYGYQGRLFALRALIPSDIGYYPPFVSLHYAFAQLAAQPLLGGTLINDHAARSALAFWHVGSVLAAYMLGERLFGRRVGIYAAGIWVLYPHVGLWAHSGDLEIPLTFAFTGAAAYFLSAWLGTVQHDRRRAAALAGLFLGIALWTKPTAGAFILGVALLSAIEAVRVLRASSDLRGAWLALRPRLEVVVITALMCLPLGGIWYVRNLMYGFPAITLPNPFWLTQALQSGAEFGWLLLALVLVLLRVFTLPAPRPARPPLLIGAGLVALGIIPTILVQYDAPG
ncbi:MAG: glycosyltransferase family 39 protein, partial [Armatimonadetes bacterium]|nr:glycosyltransferase family 39 protein [Anaerolineae bacterium]